MEVILLVDVKKLGKKGETVKVNDGYASNFLIPKKMAVKKTQGSLNMLNHQIEVEEQKQEELRNNALKIKEELEKIVLEFKVKPQKNGHMAGTISYKEIEKKLKDEFNLVIDKRKIIDKYLINAFGYTKLNIELYKNVIGVITVHVSEEK